MVSEHYKSLRKYPFETVAKKKFPNSNHVWVSSIGNNFSEVNNLINNREVNNLINNREVNLTQLYKHGTRNRGKSRKEFMNTLTLSLKLLE
ncbi:hypothetical protein RIR_jg5388.t1 [Rhizophagus irregularis DAOM 181602=DAOM 197198]|nr:hypothetical protein RIR_jg5388.t1 [Rhizophagus irregularis DAOM 181602=DAOM 197198]